MTPDKLSEVAQSDFKPSNQVQQMILSQPHDDHIIFMIILSNYLWHMFLKDILRCRVLTSGVFESKFVFKRFIFQYVLCDTYIERVISYYIICLTVLF